MQRRLVAGPAQAHRAADQQRDICDQRLHHVEGAIAGRRLVQRQLGEALAHPAAEHGVGEGVARTGGMERLDDVGRHVSTRRPSTARRSSSGGARTGPCRGSVRGDDAFHARHPEHAVLGLEPAGADADVRRSPVPADRRRPRSANERAHYGAQADQAKRVEGDRVHSGRVLAEAKAVPAIARFGVRFPLPDNDSTAIGVTTAIPSSAIEKPGYTLQSFGMRGITFSWQPDGAEDEAREKPVCVPDPRRRRRRPRGSEDGRPRSSS